MKNSLINKIKTEKLLVSDGAWGTFLQDEGLQSGECPELWNETHPNVVRNIAESYIDAGADMVETNTFGGSKHKLEMFALGEKTYDLNFLGARLSRESAGESSYVLGSIGPSGAILMMGEVNEGELYEGFLEQAKGLADGGADALCVETFSDLQEAELAVCAAKTTGLPVICTFTFENGFTMMGVTPEQYAAKMIGLDVDVLGTNCGNGLDGMIDIVCRIRKAAPEKPILVHANAGLPQTANGQIVYPETPKSMGRMVSDIVTAGANIVGGCCGTTPEHIRRIRQEIDKLK